MRAAPVSRLQDGAFSCFQRWMIGLLNKPKTWAIISESLKQEAPQSLPLGGKTAVTFGRTVTPR